LHLSKLSIHIWSLNEHLLRLLHYELLGRLLILLHLHWLNINLALLLLRMRRLIILLLRRLLSTILITNRLLLLIHIKFILFSLLWILCWGTWFFPKLLLLWLSAYCRFLAMRWLLPIIYLIAEHFLLEFFHVLLLRFHSFQASILPAHLYRIILNNLIWIFLNRSCLALLKVIILLLGRGKVLLIRRDEISVLQLIFSWGLIEFFWLLFSLHLCW
jgi:hypothetical protein